MKKLSYPDSGYGITHPGSATLSILIILLRVVDPDPDWIRIQRLCGSGSVLGIRIRIQGQENEEISVEKMHFIVIF
jgi:hypothetical protein